MQIVLQLLAESCVLAVAGASWGYLPPGGRSTRFLRVFPASAISQGFLSDKIDGRMLLFFPGGYGPDGHPFRSLSSDPLVEGRTWRLP